MKLLDFFNKLLVLICKSFVKLYQHAISPYLGPSKCRHIPTCSQYTILALEKHGFFKGLYKGFKRFINCRPGGTHGIDYP